MRAVVGVASRAERDICLAIRRRVFVEGQGVPEALELDGLDDQCTHFLARVDGAPVGTARLRVVEQGAKAERVGVIEAAQRQGVGRALMEALEDAARLRGLERLVLSAQLEAVPFYQRLGYQSHGEVFREADIPHLAMQKGL